MDMQSNFSKSENIIRKLLFILKKKKLAANFIKPGIPYSFL